MSSFFVTIAVLMFVTGLTACGVYLYTNKEKMFPPSEELSISTVRPLILTKLRNVRELGLIRSNFQSVVSFEESKKVFGKSVPGTTRKFILDYAGTVVCGVDLDRIRIAGIFVNRNHLKIIVPQSRILDIYPEISTFKLHEKNSGIFANDIELEEQNREVAADVEKVKQRLIDEGILLKSNENIRQLINSITEPLGVVADVEFTDSDELNSTPELLRLN